MAENNEKLMNLEITEESQHRKLADVVPKVLIIDINDALKEIENLKIKNLELSDKLLKEQEIAAECKERIKILEEIIKREEKKTGEDSLKEYINNNGLSDLIVNIDNAKLEKQLNQINFWVNYKNKTHQTNWNIWSGQANINRMWGKPRFPLNLKVREDDLKGEHMDVVISNDGNIACFYPDDRNTKVVIWMRYGNSDKKTNNSQFELDFSDSKTDEVVQYIINADEVRTILEFKTVYGNNNKFLNLWLSYRYNRAVERIYEVKSYSSVKRDIKIKLADRLNNKYPNYNGTIKLLGDDITANIHDYVETLGLDLRRMDYKDVWKKKFDNLNLKTLFQQPSVTSNDTLQDIDLPFLKLVTEK